MNNLPQSTVDEITEALAEIINDQTTAVEDVPYVLMHAIVSGEIPHVKVVQQ